MSVVDDWRVDAWGRALAMPTKKAGANPTFPRRLNDPEAAVERDACAGDTDFPIRNPAHRYRSPTKRAVLAVRANLFAATSARD